MSQTLLTAALLMLMLPVSGQERQLIYLHRMRLTNKPLLRF